MCSIGNISFKTKKSAEEFARKKVTSLISPTPHEQGTPGYAFLMELLCKHPRAEQTLAVGVLHFTVQRHPMNGSPQTQWTRVDGETETFGWLKCVNGRFMTDAHKLEGAMRGAISAGTMAFKQSAELQCVRCDATDKAHRDFHVDHVFPFSRIKADFLAARADEPPTVFDWSTASGIAMFAQADAKFEDEWRQYHDGVALFQILCNVCNGRKGARI